MAGLSVHERRVQGLLDGAGLLRQDVLHLAARPAVHGRRRPDQHLDDQPGPGHGGRWMADWRKRFFLYPGRARRPRGRRWTTTAGCATPTGVWQAQDLGGTVQYVPNYDAILKWIKNGPQTLPPSLRAGRVLYYSAIPDCIPMNWQTGLINSGATADQRFWKDYIDFVIGAGRHDRKKTLYGYGTEQHAGPGRRSAPRRSRPGATLTGTTRSRTWHYDDIPVHPRLHMWFGPLTMLGVPVPQLGQPRTTTGSPGRRTRPRPGSSRPASSRPSTTSRRTTRTTWPASTSGPATTATTRPGWPMGRGLRQDEELPVLPVLARQHPGRRRPNEKRPYTTSHASALRTRAGSTPATTRPTSRAGTAAPTPRWA